LERQSSLPISLDAPPLPPQSSPPKATPGKSSKDNWRLVRRNVIPVETDSTGASPPRPVRSRSLSQMGSMSNMVSVRGMEHYSNESSSRRMTRLRSLSVEQQSIITANDEAFMVLSQPQGMDSSNHGMHVYIHV
jgi:hypothetical protein